MSGVCSNEKGRGQRVITSKLIIISFWRHCMARILKAVGILESLPVDLYIYSQLTYWGVKPKFTSQINSTSRHSFSLMLTSSSDNILLNEKESFSPLTLEKLSVVAKNSYGLKNPPIGNSESYTP